MSRIRPLGMPLLLLFLWSAGCDSGFADPSREYAEPLATDRTWPTTVHEPTAFGVLATPLLVDSAEREVPAGTRCETCHDQPPDPTWQPEEGELFHSGVEVTHGQLTCDQCHDRQSRELHLSDRTIVPWVEVLRLCAQCHGTQHRDYKHGAHGGLNGYWDDRQGTKLRNNCVDCHAPHAPAFGKRKPVFPPKDRYLHGLDGGASHSARPAADAHAPAPAAHHE